MQLKSNLVPIEWRATPDQMRRLLREHFAEEFAQRLKSPSNIAKSVFMTTVINALVIPPFEESFSSYGFLLARIFASLCALIGLMKWWEVKQFSMLWNSIESAVTKAGGIVQSVAPTDSKIIVSTNGTFKEYSKGQLRIHKFSLGAVAFEKLGNPVVWIPRSCEKFQDALTKLTLAA